MTQTIIVAEIGINHNGDIEIAKKLIEEAAWAGADYVKFQVRDPYIAVPKDQWDELRKTPWGEIRYIDYKVRMEFSFEELRELSRHARQHDIGMFLSVWDLRSLEVASTFAFDMVKIPSAKLTDEKLVRAAVRLIMKQPCDLVLSTGMSTSEEIGEMLGWVRYEWQGWSEPTYPGKIGSPILPHVWVLHCHSAYPAPTKELNLLAMAQLDGWCEALGPIPHSIGYSGHEWGIQPTVWSVALGAQMVERHITLDRTMWGTDQSSSVEPLAFAKMVSYIRSLEFALGDGVKKVWDSELSARTRLRGET